jgi:hypothetical protein
MTAVTAAEVRRRSGEYDLDAVRVLTLPRLELEVLGAVALCHRLKASGRRLSLTLTLTHSLSTTGQELDVSYNRVADLTPLARLRELETLRATGNRIRTLTPLREHPTLSQLFLAGNLLSDGQALLAIAGSLPGLRRLDLQQLDGSEPNPGNPERAVGRTGESLWTLRVRRTAVRVQCAVRSSTVRRCGVRCPTSL